MVDTSTTMLWMLIVEMIERHGQERTLVVYEASRLPLLPSKTSKTHHGRHLIVFLLSSLYLLLFFLCLLLHLPISLPIPCILLDL